MLQNKDLPHHDAHLAAIVQSSGEAIISTTLYGEILSWNLGAESLFGFGADEVIGLNMSMFVPPDLHSESDEFRAMLRLGQKIENFETRRMSKTGEPIDVSLSLWPTLSESGEIKSCSLICRDITRQKYWQNAVQELNEKLKESNAALAQSNLELQQFAYVASHDLQTPLRHISTLIGMLLKNHHDQLDNEAQEWISMIDASANRMGLLIDDLLEYARVDSRKSALTQLDLAESVNDAVQVLQGSIQESAANVNIEALPQIQGDPAQLSQLFQNLIGNAIKYRGSAPPEIAIACHSTDDEHIVSIRDNGIGVKPEYHTRIFEIFQRLHSQSEFPGTGIGLAVCKRIAERHDARIWVESEVGTSSTFFVAFPISILTTV
ncbi:MAG: ATP-binding protein [Pseudomonadota bacterium]